MTHPELMTIGEVMRALQRSRKFVIRLIELRHLRCARVNKRGDRMFLRREIEAFLEKGVRG